MVMSAVEVSYAIPSLPPWKPWKTAKPDVSSKTVCEFLPDRSLEVGLLWKSKHRPRNNGEQALRVFLKMEKRMRGTPGLWEEFDRTVQDWLAKGYASILNMDLKGQGFYIPTFMVIREDKLTTKFRLIVNGKFEFKNKSITITCTVVLML